MAERETVKQAWMQWILWHITPSQDTTSLSQQLQGKVTSTHSATADPSPATTNIAITTGPLTSLLKKNSTNSQLGLGDDVTMVSQSLLLPGLQNVNTQSISTAVYQNVSVLKENSIASGAFLFGPSDDAFSKDHSQLLCVSDGAGNTIPLPVRQSRQQNIRNVCRSFWQMFDVSEDFEYSRKQKSLSIVCSRCVSVSVYMCVCVSTLSVYMCVYVWVHCMS